MKCFGFSLSIAAFTATCILLAQPARAQPAACEPAKLAQKYPGLANRTLKIGADPQTQPYVMRDDKDFNKVEGADADLARAVLDCIGAKYEFFLGGWSGLLPAVMSGQIDVMWDNLYYKPERAKTVDFLIYMGAGTGAMVPAGNPDNIKSKDDFCGHTVSYAVGSAEEKIVEQQDDDCKAAGKRPVGKMPFQDLAAGMRLLDSKRTEILLWDLGFIDATVAANKDKYARAFGVVGTFAIGAAFKKDDADLRKALVEGLEAVQANGDQKRILAKYGIDPSLERPAEIKAN
jgi:polar amino acid transport system substrate-binding protein